MINFAVGKLDNDNKAVIANCYLENTNVNLHWMTKTKSVTIAGCMLNNVAVAGTSPYVVMLGNTDLA